VEFTKRVKKFDIFHVITNVCIGSIKIIFDVVLNLSVRQFADALKKVVK